MYSEKWVMDWLRGQDTRWISWVKREDQEARKSCKAASGRAILTKVDAPSVWLGLARGSDTSPKNKQTLLISVVFLLEKYVSQYTYGFVDYDTCLTLIVISKLYTAQ